MITKDEYEINLMLKSSNNFIQSRNKIKRNNYMECKRIKTIEIDGLEFEILSKGNEFYIQVEDRNYDNSFTLEVTREELALFTLELMSVLFEK